MEFTLAQGVLLTRYIAGRYLQSATEGSYRLKYIALLIAVPFLFGIGIERNTATTAGGGLLVMIFVLAAIVQWFVTRTIRRLGALDQLAELDDISRGAVSDWWPSLRAEFRRVGLKSSPWGMLKLGASYATRRASAEQKTALGTVDWSVVLPVDHLFRAHAVVAQAADDSS
jgi:hypothetical protein